MFKEVPRRLLVVSFRYLIVTCWVVSVMTPTFAQTTLTAGRSLVEDWSSHHAIFSSPGSEMEAIMSGHRQQWQEIVNSPRYQMQQILRDGLWPGLKRSSISVLQDATQAVSSLAELSSESKAATALPRSVDWAVTLADSTQSSSSFAAVYPAKYISDPLGLPSCSNDFVVFVVNSAGNSSNQSNIVGVNNLYQGFCTGAVPSVMFSYYVGTGPVLTSPVISADGTKIAFIESIGGGNLGPYFHVLTLSNGTSEGNEGCPNRLPCNGTAYDAPLYLQPGDSPLTNATQGALQMNGGNGANITRSSPFIDYKNDIAYVGDDGGRLHKFTGVFLGKPAEVKTGGWPVTIDSSTALTSPVFDSGASQQIFLAGVNSGKIYCVTVSGTLCTTPSVKVGGGIQQGPIVDSTSQMIFVSTTNTAVSNAILFQTNTSLSDSISVTMGSAGNDLYNGTFDNAYYEDPSSGHMYYCGGMPGSISPGTPALYRIGFDSSGNMNATNDGNIFQLVNTGDSYGNYDCTPLTEAYNGVTDMLFLGVKGGARPSGCRNQGCIMSFDITSSFPTTVQSTLVTGSQRKGTSAIITDNFSTVPAASQVYFMNLNTGAGVQASQANLK